MEDINIQANGFTLHEEMRENILQSLHSVFGFNQQNVKNITITLFDEKNLGSDRENCCKIEIKIKNQPKITTELKSFDIVKATTLAIERAHLKTSRRLKGDKYLRMHIDHSKSISSF